MYLRKSSSDEGRQQLSIPAQERELRQLAERRGLVLVGEPIRESMSAKKPGRPRFATMMTRLQGREANAILCWHLNRLARNPVDGGAVMWALGQGTIQEILTSERAFTGTPDDKLMMSIIFGMATKDIDDLSRNVKRGNREALLEGYLPGRPKLGYVRDRQSNKLVRDPERWDLIVEAFRLRRLGVPVREILHKARTEWGLTTPQTRSTGGALISCTTLHRVLADPFYAGLVVRKEGSFQGNHEPMISWADFEVAQRQTRHVDSSGPRPRSHTFTYRGLIRCGACAALVTAEHTRNRFGTLYTYYHCCRKNRRYRFCPEPSIEEKQLEAHVAAALAGLALPRGVLELALEELERIAGKLQTNRDQALENLRAQLEKNERTLRNLRLMAAEGRITAEELDADRTAMLDEQVRLRADLERHHPSRALIEPWSAAFSLASTAHSEFMKGDSDRKRELVIQIFSNLTLKQKTPLIEAKFPFRLCAELAGCSSVRAVRSVVRTMATDHHSAEYSNLLTMSRT